MDAELRREIQKLLNQVSASLESMSPGVERDQVEKIVQHVQYVQDGKTRSRG